MADGKEYREKEIKKRILGGEYPHGSTHVPGQDAIPGLTNGLVSNPPSGKHKVVNIYWDEDLQKIVVEKESEPAP